MPENLKRMIFTLASIKKNKRAFHNVQNKNPGLFPLHTNQVVFCIISTKASFREILKHKVEYIHGALPSL